MVIRQVSSDQVPADQVRDEGWWVCSGMVKGQQQQTVVRVVIKISCGPGYINQPKLHNGAADPGNRARSQVVKQPPTHDLHRRS
jgi:hypothetical protein